MSLLAQFSCRRAIAVNESPLEARVSCALPGEEALDGSFEDNRENRRIEVRQGVLTDRFRGSEAHVYLLRR